MSEAVIGINRQRLIRLLEGLRVQVATSVGLLTFETHVPPWEPMRQIPMREWVRERQESFGIDTSHMEVWHNEEYEAFAVTHEESGVTHLSVKRYDRAPLSNWRHLQQIKNEVCGPEREGLQLYPRESRVADNANQYHLYVLPVGMDVPVGFEHGMFITPEETALFNSSPHPGRQEPMQEGLTIGDTILAARTDEDAETIRKALTQE